MSAVLYRGKRWKVTRKGKFTYDLQRTDYRGEKVIEWCVPLKKVTDPAPPTKCTTDQ